ncbi:MAG: LysR family transcriptional regulator [Lachnospiraceae bacterium]|nr:LysR family transcriptional regulator [Lachnospiraceae bacterium]
MNVNMEYYRIFYHVAKHGKISAAAEELSLTQPAVSQAIRQLERNLGSPLFVRSSKGVTLTVEGESLYFYVKRGYEYIRTGEAKFREMQNLESGEVRIGASDMTLKYYLLSYLEEFHERYPGIKVSVTNAPTPTTLKYMLEGKIDFGVVSSPIEEQSGIRIRKVRKVRDIFVAGEKFGDLKGQKLSYSDLVQYPIICLEKNTSTRKYVDEFLEKNSVVLQPEFELATSDMIVQFARRNLGIASVVKDFALESLEQGELFELEFTEQIPSRNFCIVTGAQTVMSNAARALLESLE